MAANPISRNPRYAVLIVVAVLTTVYLLSGSNLQAAYPSGRYGRPIKNADLDTRIQQSSEIYDRLLENRKGLIKKFGPEPKDIALSVFSCSLPTHSSAEDAE